MSQSLGYKLHIFDTAIGRVLIKESLVENVDVDDIMAMNTISQGVDLQFQLMAEQDRDPALIADALPTLYTEDI